MERIRKISASLIKDKENPAPKPIISRPHKLHKRPRRLSDVAADAYASVRSLVSRKESDSFLGEHARNKLQRKASDSMLGQNARPGYLLKRTPSVQRYQRPPPRPQTLDRERISAPTQVPPHALREKASWETMLNRRAEQESRGRTSGDSKRSAEYAYPRHPAPTAPAERGRAVCPSGTRPEEAPQLEYILSPPPNPGSLQRRARARTQRRDISESALDLDDVRLGPPRPSQTPLRAPAPLERKDRLAPVSPPRVGHPPGPEHRAAAPPRAHTPLTRTHVQPRQAPTGPRERAVPPQRAAPPSTSRPSSSPRAVPSPAPHPQRARPAATRQRSVTAPLSSVTAPLSSAPPAAHPADDDDAPTPHTYAASTLPRATRAWLAEQPPERPRTPGRPPTPPPKHYVFNAFLSRRPTPVSPAHYYGAHGVVGAGGGVGAGAGAGVGAGGDRKEDVEEVREVRARRVVTHTAEARRSAHADVLGDVAALLCAPGPPPPPVPALPPRAQESWRAALVSTSVSISSSSSSGSSGSTVSSATESSTGSSSRGSSGARRRDEARRCREMGYKERRYAS